MRTENGREHRPRPLVHNTGMVCAFYPHLCSQHPPSLSVALCLASSLIPNFSFHAHTQPPFCSVHTHTASLLVLYLSSLEGGSIFIKEQKRKERRRKQGRKEGKKEGEKRKEMGRQEKREKAVEEYMLTLKQIPLSKWEWSLIVAL